MRGHPGHGCVWEAYRQSPGLSSSGALCAIIAWRSSLRRHAQAALLLVCLPTARLETPTDTWMRTYDGLISSDSLTACELQDADTIPRLAPDCQLLRKPIAPIGKDGAYVLATLFASPSCALIAAQLEQQDFDDHGVTLLAESLFENKRLSLLDVHYNSITAMGAASLAAMLKRNKGLRWLDLRINEVGDVGAEAISTSLKTNVWLQWLNLESNGIGEKGGIALAGKRESPSR